MLSSRRHFWGTFPVSVFTQFENGFPCSKTSVMHFNKFFSNVLALTVCSLFFKLKHKVCRANYPLLKGCLLHSLIMSLAYSEGGATATLCVTQRL